MTDGLYWECSSKGSSIMLLWQQKTIKLEKGLLTPVSQAWCKLLWFPLW